MILQVVSEMYALGKWALYEWVASLDLNYLQSAPSNMHECGI